MRNSQILSRKEDHLRICLGKGLETGDSALFEDVILVHNAIPELDYSRISAKTRLFGKELAAPLMVSGMVGGTAASEKMNSAIAEAVGELGLAMGVGSQRAMLAEPATARTFKVCRKRAPTALLFGNVGLVQFTTGHFFPKDAARAVSEIGADGLFIHLNPAQELVQPEGDRDFRGGLRAIERICDELDGIPVLAKETGCGLSASVGRRLVDAGVSGLDVSGAGGTNWIAVERQRTKRASPADALLSAGWGIPTAASVLQVAGLGVPVIASGGVADGIDCAKALALGASACSIGRPVLKAYAGGGKKGIVSLLQDRMTELKAAMFLTGSATIQKLRKADRKIVGRLREWQRPR